MIFDRKPIFSSPDLLEPEAALFGSQTEEVGDPQETDKEREGRHQHGAVVQELGPNTWPQKNINFHPINSELGNSCFGVFPMQKDDSLTCSRKLPVRLLLLLYPLHRGVHQSDQQIQEHDDSDDLRGNLYVVWEINASRNFYNRKGRRKGLEPGTPPSRR